MQAELSEPQTFDEAMSLVKFVRTCLADKLMASIRSPHGAVEVDQGQLFMWRKLLNQALQCIERLDSHPQTPPPHPPPGTKS